MNGRKLQLMRDKEKHVQLLLINFGKWSGGVPINIPQSCHCLLSHSPAPFTTSQTRRSIFMEGFSSVCFCFKMEKMGLKSAPGSVGMLRWKLPLDTWNKPNRQVPECTVTDFHLITAVFSLPTCKHSHVDEARTQPPIEASGLFVHESNLQPSDSLRGGAQCCHFADMLMTSRWSKASFTKQVKQRQPDLFEAVQQLTTTTTTTQQPWNAFWYSTALT